jgi:hypothetical protein
MLRADDFVHIPYTPDLNQVGIHSACRWLALVHEYPKGSVGEPLRRILGEKAVDLAFRRSLSTSGVPFDSLGNAPFTDPEHYDVILGGRRCEVKTIPISQERHARGLRRHPDWLLQISVQVSEEQLFATQRSDLDLFIFSFILTAPQPRPAGRRVFPQARAPQFLIHPLPKHWAQPTGWAAMGMVNFKNELSPNLALEIGGQDSHHQFTTEQILLPAGTPCQNQQEFYTLAYLYTQNTPRGRLAIQCPKLKETYLIQPGAWEDIWIHGTEVILAGWMSRADFRQNAARLPRGSRPIQSIPAHTPHRWLPIAALHPMSELFEAARLWAKR